MPKLDIGNSFRGGSEDWGTDFSYLKKKKCFWIFANKSLLLIIGLPAVHQRRKTTGVRVFAGSNRKPQICRSCEKVLVLTSFFKNWWVLCCYILFENLWLIKHASMNISEPFQFALCFHWWQPFLYFDENSSDKSKKCMWNRELFGMCSFLRMMSWRRES